MIRCIIIVLWLTTIAAYAEQPATALQRCGSDVGRLAIRVDDLAEQLDQARLKIGELQKQIDEAKIPKLEEKK